MNLVADFVVDMELGGHCARFFLEIISKVRVIHTLVRVLIVVVPVLTVVGRE